MTDPAPSDTGGSEVYLGRQPILDAAQQLSAYELLFRSGRENVANVDDAVRATATVITNTFSELALGNALDSHRGFVNVDHDMLFSDALELLPANAVTLEILETVPITEAVVARCRELVDKGFTLALDDVVDIDERWAPMLALASVIKVDIQLLDDTALRTLAERLRPWGKTLLAEKVDTRERMELCRALGFTLFQGYYFARPTIIKGRRLDHAQLALVRLLSLVMRDADTGEIEQALKGEPGLTVNLLRLTNSVACGLATRITSLRHAITVLGRRQLQRWLQLLMFASSGGRADGNPLLHLAATRGRLMELLAGRLAARGARIDAEHAFMTGIMSLIPAVLGQPIEEILAQLPIAPAVEKALTEHAGPLGALLALAEASEMADAAGTAAALQRVGGLTGADFNATIAQALAWAGALGREADSAA